MPGITISASYGTGGEAVAPLVAERLGYRLLDRAITADIATALDISETEAAEGERKPTFGERFLHAVLPMSPFLVSDPDGTFDGSDDFRAATERIMGEAVEGGAVVLGRAGAAALRGRSDVLRVRLYGDVEGRIASAMAATGIDEKTAREQLPVVDGARARYWEHLYGMDIDDPALYHLQMNATLLTPPRCAAMIVEAFHGFLPSAV